MIARTAQALAMRSLDFGRQVVAVFPLVPRSYHRREVEEWRKRYVAARTRGDLIALERTRARNQRGLLLDVIWHHLEDQGVNGDNAALTSAFLGVRDSIRTEGNTR